MKIVYENGAEPGEGKFIVTGIENPVDGQWQMALYNSNLQYSTESWKNPLVDTETFIPVRGVQTGPDSLEIDFGPVVVDNLNPLLNYVVTLKDPSGQKLKKKSVVISNVARSTDKGLSHKEAPLMPEEAPPARESNLKFEESGNSEKSDDAASNENLDLNEALGAADKIEVEIPEAPGTLTDVKFVEESPETDMGGISEAENLEMPQPVASGKKYLLIGAIVGLLILIGVLIWLYIGMGSVKTESRLTIEEQVRSFMQNPDKSAQLAMDLAQGLNPDNDAEKDALYRLYYYAAQQGNSAAALKYGEVLDPAAPQWGSIEKDGFFAWESLEKARSANVPGAEEALQNLEKWLSDEAAKGNASAQKWLAQIKAAK